MSQPVLFDISTNEGRWCLHKDGAAMHEYSHADRAIHEAVMLAREIEQTGQPVKILLHAADGKVIEVTTDLPPQSDDVGAPGDERSALDAHH